MIKLVNDGVRLLPATIEHLHLEEQSSALLAASLQAATPPSWPPEHNGAETRAWVRRQLTLNPQHAYWYSWYVIAVVDGVSTLSGIAGYKGPPDSNGGVEIGYSIVPELRRKGIATKAVLLLCSHAFGCDASCVVAETLPQLVASRAVLEKTGFRRTAVTADPDYGEIWRYQLDRT